MNTFCKRLLACIAFIVLATGLSSCAKPKHGLAEGQLWEATDSWLVIGKIDSFPELVVVRRSFFD